MELYLNAQNAPCVCLSCHELSRVPIFCDEAVFDAQFECDGIEVRLFSTVPELEEHNGLPTLSVPLIADREARRDWAAAVAFVFCASQGLEAVGLRLSEEHVQTVTKNDAFRAVLAAFRALCDILHLTPDSIRFRHESLAALRFPFSSLRAGQKKLMQESYAAMRDRKNLFALAPTGIGKTLSVLYPAFKALGRRHIAKAFYLTPRGSLQPQVAASIRLLQADEPYLHTITLCAKARICQSGHRCEHSVCKNKRPARDAEAKALRRLFETYGHITPSDVQAVAHEFELCPFELSLTASLYCEVVVCDYNYIFDPHASLKRYQSREEKYAILCDEAHNLVARVRESFSAALTPKMLEVFATPLFAKQTEITSAAKSLANALFLNRPNPAAENRDPISFSPPTHLLGDVAALCEALCPLTSKKSGAEFSAELITTAKELYFALSAFLEAADAFDLHYSLCTYEDGGVKLILVDPSERVGSITRDFGMCIFFSATLSPKNYYLGMLGGEEDDFLDLPSPFDPEHLRILTCPISTFYHDRERTADLAARIIACAVRPKVGNYMVFFPSFEYMNRVVEAYRKLRPRDLILCQTPQMNERAREDYLAAFSVKRSERLLGFAVMGGLFSEGVDLVGDKLLGEVVFGVGMPPPTPEAEAVRRRFDEREEDGAALGYTYPGFNRVLQSAGRVIRSATDRGFLILCDERYLSEGFSALFPSFWSEPVPVGDVEEVEHLIRTFWEESDDALS